MQQLVAHIGEQLQRGGQRPESRPLAVVARPVSIEQFFHLNRLGQQIADQRAGQNHRKRRLRRQPMGDLQQPAGANGDQLGKFTGVDHHWTHWLSLGIAKAGRWVVSCACS